MKLLGNSAYGKTVTDQLKHGVMYEADMFKSAINLTLSLQIDFFVYQYAKLQMLEFSLDFLMKFVAPRYFQMCEMDTDSAYMAISGDSLNDVIKPEHTWTVQLWEEDPGAVQRSGRVMV